MNTTSYGQLTIPTLTNRNHTNGINVPTIATNVFHTNGNVIFLKYNAHSDDMELIIVNATRPSIPPSLRSSNQ